MRGRQDQESRQSGEEAGGETEQGGPGCLPWNQDAKGGEDKRFLSGWGLWERKLTASRVISLPDETDETI